MKYIEIKNARVNNLKNVSLKIPQGKFVVITGVSGSGKSSLAFDTLYAEGQRRYVESLSAYARQFMGRMQKPECDYIKGLPPAIAIEQKTVSRNPRSTVGTSTEIYEYLRLLFARIGRTYSPVSGKEVKKHSVDDILSCIQSYEKGTKFYIQVAAMTNHTDEYSCKQIVKLWLQEGYTKVDYNGTVIDIEEFLGSPLLLKAKKEKLYLVIDRLSVNNTDDWMSRVTDSCETAFFEGNGKVRLKFLPSEKIHEFSTRFEADGIVFAEPDDNMFSFNSPLGACPKCEGFGNIMGIDEHIVIPDPSRSVYEDVVMCWRGEKMSEWKDEFIRKAADYDFPIFEPYFRLTQEQKDILWHGPEGTSPQAEYEDPQWFPSIDRFFEFVRKQQYKVQYRVMLSRYRGKERCPVCHGTRLRKEASFVKILDHNINDLVQMPVHALYQWTLDLLSPKGGLTENELHIGRRLITEIQHRLQYLLDVGLGYLTLNRPSNTLSGGESQRINLTTSIGSSLVGSLYILDEPTVGLHQRDTARLLNVIRQLTDIGNTVVVVEHDEEVIRAADYIIDVGPDAGIFGGTIVFQGAVETSTKSSSYTLDYLTGKRQIAVPQTRRPWNRYIELKGARHNNLKGIDIRIPLNVMTVVTGVSGSGKSSLISSTLYPAMKRHMDEPADIPGEYSELSGDLKAIQHIEFVDQHPIGKSSRSNPATYVKAFDYIRDLYAEQQLAKQMNFKPQFFSFNAEGGRCEECKGSGIINVEMQFMADISLECEACHGKRFKQEVLEVTYKGKNINDVLNMSIDEAIEFFADKQPILKRLQPLHDVGLGYIKMGQHSSSLSGGENQRVKLAYFIGREKGESVPSLFIFDEPTTGLHLHDIQKLLDAFNALITKGHTILVIEHNLEIIKNADHIIDLGPEGGDKGGELIATGTPEHVATIPHSITGQYLKQSLEKA